MRRPFGMLVESSMAMPRPQQGIVFTGPSIGMPDVGQALTIRGAFSRPTRQRLNGIMHFHRSSSSSRTGVIVNPGRIPPETFRGAVVYEEGVLFRVFSGFTSAHPLRAPARYQLRDGIADGIVHVEKGIINAFVIGGGLPEGDSLWQELTQIDYGSGSLLRSEIQPVAERWLVPILQMYGLSHTSIMVTSPCGPAAVDFPLLVYQPAVPIEAHVILQQASGVVQVDGEMKFATPPRALSSPVWNLPDVN